MRILVTGGAGYIGIHTAVALHEAGYTPVILDNFSQSDRSVLSGLASIIGYRAPLVEADCTDATQVRRAIREERIDGVIHFAAFKAVGESMAEPLRYYRNNVGATLALLEAMLSEQVARLIFSSSCTVYGIPQQLPVTESAPTPPAASVYGNTKQICEEILRDMAAAGKPLQAVALRYFNPIGAHPSGQIGELPLGVPNNLVPFVTQTAAGRRPKLTVFGNDYDTPDGTCIRDYIHVMDLAEAHVAALRFLEKKPTGPGFEVFNIGTGKGASVLEIIQTFEQATGMALPYSFGPRREGDVPAVYADASTAQKALEWSAARSVRDALADAWRWQQHLERSR